MTFHLPQLHEFAHLSLEDDKLFTPIQPRFFVPRLPEIPLNPIVDNVKYTLAFESLPDRPSAAASLKQLPAPAPIIHEPHQEISVWTRAALDFKSGVSTKHQAASWDSLQPSPTFNPAATPFLSEQDSLLVASARYHVMSQLDDGRKEFVHFTQDELLRNLKRVVLGISSQLYQWNLEQERFVQGGVSDGRLGVVLVDGHDELLSESIISGFLTTGTLLRRLDTYVLLLRSQAATSTTGPTVTSFAHAISTTLSYVRECISQSVVGGSGESLSEILVQLADYRSVCEVLADLCAREEEVHPDQYIQLDTSSSTLLSRIFNHLGEHIERQSPRIVLGILAYVLASTSRQYLDKIAKSVAFGGVDTSFHFPLIGTDGVKANHPTASGLADVGPPYPAFFPPQLSDILRGAQKSFTLLRAAQPDHEVFRHSGPAQIQWTWSPGDLQFLSSHGYSPPKSIPSPSDIPAAVEQPFIETGGVVYKQELEVFQVFDLEPGGQMEGSVFNTKSTTSNVRELKDVISSFPSSFPLITPTLTHVADIVFEPLRQHAATLSGALLSMFLSASGTLNFCSHMEVLRSHLLLTSPAFKSRLSAALFTDSDHFDSNSPSQNRWLLHNLRRQASESNAGNLSRPWAVGLAPALLDREIWPPVGTDLSFLLRTVIVDSFENVGLHGESRRRLLEERENRLGFAIRDLPTGPGRDKWLNPLTIEAFDFLYMEYKPPHPLDIVITPSILSQYQRMFTFLLRILRVEHALRALHRMTRSHSAPLFATLSIANKCMLHFRFIAHSYVTALSGYVFDTVIKGHFNAFLRKLEPQAGTPFPFADVFALSDAHYELLNEVLTACLLRSNQKSVSNLIRDTLQLVLDFAVHVGELQRGRLEEYETDTALMDIYRKFREKMLTMIRVLKSTEKTYTNSRLPSSTDGSPSGVETLSNLLLRFDLGEWWENFK